MNNQNRPQIKPLWLSREYFLFTQLKEFVLNNSLESSQKFAEMISNLNFDYDSPRSSIYKLLTCEQKQFLKNLHMRRNSDSNFNQQVQAIGGTGILILSLGFIGYKLIEQHSSQND
jgi:hypothetical protein